MHASEGHTSIIPQHKVPSRRKEPAGRHEVARKGTKSAMFTYGFNRFAMIVSLARAPLCSLRWFAT